MTSSELFALPPDTAGVDRWLFSGRLVERWNGNVYHTPTHSAAATAVSIVLGRWCAGQGRGSFRAFGYGCPYRLGSDPDTVVSYDASIVRSDGKTIPPDCAHLEGPPLLAVEVVERDEDPDLLRQLVGESLGFGVPSVWVIDPFEEVVVWHRPGEEPLYINGTMELIAGPHLPGLRCPVAEIFE